MWIFELIWILIKGFVIFVPGLFFILLILGKDFGSELDCRGKDDK